MKQDVLEMGGIGCRTGFPSGVSPQQFLFGIIDAFGPKSTRTKFLDSGKSDGALANHHHQSSLSTLCRMAPALPHLRDDLATKL